MCVCCMRTVASSPKVCTRAAQQTLYACISMQLETCVFVCLDVVYFMPCVMCRSLTLSFETLNMPQLFISKSTQDKARHHRRWRSSYICIFHQAQWRVETCALCFPLSLIFYVCLFLIVYCLFWAEMYHGFATDPTAPPLSL